MGSSPSGRATSVLERVLQDLPTARRPDKANGQPTTSLQAAIEAFLLNRRVANCSAQTLRTYAYNLQRFERSAGVEGLHEVTTAVVQHHLTALREHIKAVSVHQPFRVLRAFFAWCGEAGMIGANPMRGLTMKTPRTLPRVPEDAEVSRLLAACPDTFEGRRNRALIALLADSGLRSSEALRLRIEDVNFTTRTISVRGDKGGKDGVGFFGAETALLLRTWLAKRRDAHPEDFLFVDRLGRSLKRDHATRILHRLSAKAGLTRKIGPHALRHYAATSILRQTGDLELVRQVLRHESLAMALRYAHLTKPDVSAKFRRASCGSHTHC